MAPRGGGAKGRPERADLYSMQQWCPLAGRQLGGASAATDDGKSCGQAVFGERRTAALAEANLLPVQRPRPGGNESHNSVTGLSAQLRTLCRLNCGNARRTGDPWPGQSGRAGPGGGDFPGELVQ
jgi:hypothetical protein